MTPGFGGIHIRKLIEDRAGGMWLLGSGASIQVGRYANGCWTSFAAAAGIPAGSFIRALHVARDRSVWISGFDAIRVLRPGQNRFVRVADGSKSVDDIVEDAAGRIWVPDAQGGLRVIAAPASDSMPGKIDYPSDPKHDLRGLMFDRDGAVWGQPHSAGLVRIVPPRPGTSTPSRVEAFTQKEGLTSDSGRALLEDREHNIWVGTALGLDRFRVANVVLETAIPQMSPYGYIVFGDHHGTIYVADTDTLYRVAPHGSPVPILRNIDNPQAICEASDGDIWLAATSGMYRVRNSVVRAVKGPDFTGFYLQCEDDHHGGLKFLTHLGGFYRYADDAWSKVEAVPLAANQLATLFTFDKQGRHFVYYENLGLKWTSPDGSTGSWPASQINGERLGVLAAGRDDTLVGTMASLARIRRGNVAQLPATYPWLHHVTGIVRTPRGDTWLQSSSGIFRVPTTTLEAAFDHPSRALLPAVFDARDGLPGVNQMELSANGAAAGGDGRVWFTTVNGIVWIDPSKLARNPVVPPVLIKRIIADGVARENPVSVELAKATKNLEIDYAALSLTMPERVAFRYRLEGVDDRWIDPGTRRQAFYANLAPGNYRFTVIAANNDGVWNRTGASVRLTLPPTFVQSWMFKLLCAVAALISIWVIYRLRLNTITGRLKTRLEGRLAERERIARDLHDTLLQGVHGLILRFQGIADRLPREQVLGRLMEKALERAEELLVEGRERVHDLRSGVLPDDLRAAVTSTVTHADLPASIAVDIRQTGRARDLDRVVRDELIWIVREALSNVVRHAEATRVDIVLAYRWDRLVVSISDDGRGLSLATGLPADGRRYGMTGMRERAGRIAATLALGANVDGIGTKIVVTVSGRSAFPGDTGRRLRAVFGLSSTEVPA
ncbi:hypothetical protein KX816_06360 [Sphingosinicellaceae bacterium]|nr:hypothetical protein KX816_06360 [Sphingosinicellaceae bacterium]